MKLLELLNIMRKISVEIKTSTPMICGGTPRDKFLKRLDHISDLDITTGDKTVNYLSDTFARELKKKYNLTHKSMNDGHSSIFIGNLKVDFSSNFNSPNITSILMKMGINQPTEMQKEIFSRDLTCNALLLSLDLKEFSDPTHRGFKDIQDRVIRTCLSPEITLTTNRNRVIRTVYLACKLDFDVDNSIIKFVSNHPESVKIASQKTVIEKLNKAFSYDPERANYLITKMNLWNYIPITKVVYPYYLKQVKGVNLT